MGVIRHGGKHSVTIDGQVRRDHLTNTTNVKYD